MRGVKWGALALAAIVSLSTDVRTATAFSGAAAAAWAATPARALTVTVLSSRPDTVSGGDALIRVTAPDAVPLDRIRVEAGGADVTRSLHEAGRGHALEGLVKGLDEGPNRLTASVPGDQVQPAELVVENHPRSGPVFAGPHETPFICDTQEFVLVTGARLGEPLDQDCSVRTRTDFVYRTTGGRLSPLPNGTTRPADLAWTTISTGERVPYIVRVETGTINRAVYEIAMLADPEDRTPSPWQRSPGWNGKLIYTFGGGCSGGWYVQGRTTGGVTQNGMLAKGYAVASSSLNVFGNNCNDLLAAESVAMVKERFIEGYGPAAFTVGWGCSGGSYQAQQIGDNYPGLLDGIIVGCSFPDVGFGTVHTLSDARLLDHYFRQVARGTFTKEQQRRISGFGRWESIATLATSGGRIDPRTFCPRQLPARLRYHPRKNPHGARCDVYSHTANAYGTDPETGLVRRPLDNVGIEYGRRALQDGKITVDQFLDLNEGIGGFDPDAGHVQERTVADPEGIRAAYRTGRLLSGGGGLAGMPIIDYRDYTDDAAGGDIHLRFHSFSTRSRLKKANGTSANQVMLVEDGSHGAFTTANPLLREALDRMDTWLTRLRADPDPGTPLEKVVRNKPADLTDACWTRGKDSVKIVERQEPGIGTTRCNTQFPVWPSPRMVAGARVENDVIKCQLKPVDPRAYGIPMSRAQERRLRQIFPGGVCDWNRPGVGQQAPDGTWQLFPSSRRA